MIANALIIGFFTAVGWISAQKLMSTPIDLKTTTVVVPQER